MSTKDFSICNLGGSKERKVKRRDTEKRTKEGEKRKQFEAEQEKCRSPRKIFLHGKVFNTDVDKFVEKTDTDKANLLFFNAVMRFAQLLCNKIFAHRDFCGVAAKNKSEVLCFVWNANCVRNFPREISV